MAVQLLKRLFTVVEYHRMAEAGILGEDDRVELLEGEIVQMSPIRSRHASCVKRLLDGQLHSLASRKEGHPQRSGPHRAGGALRAPTRLDRAEAPS